MSSSFEFGEIEAMRSLTLWTGVVVLVSATVSGCGQAPGVTTEPLQITGPNEVILEVAGMS